MFIVQENIVNTVELMTMLASIPGYTFVVVVNLKDWINTKKLRATDQLITGISMTGLLFQLMETIGLCYYVHTNSYLYREKALKPSVAIYRTVMSCNLWFCSWLCVHFCLKIVKINRVTYIYLQRTFHKMLPWLLMPSVVGSILVTVPVVLDLAEDSSPLPSSQTLNTSGEDNVFPTRPYVNISLSYLIYIIGYVLGSSICWMSGLTIVISLYRHMKHMELNAEGSRSPSKEAHIRAVKTLISILVLNLLSLIVLILTTLKETDPNWPPALTIITSIFHTLSSLSLINGNSKLHKAIISTVTCLSTRST
ncbi:taste receptor type 2 member 40-like [Spea bombifrons]|uniref:taste receptor type 2 member 40-like n=1 Tax=Spea bombifrons TaxID=233779 RepID=UPI00234962F7|nr:taste receptor type 2 member 40-like [Spea bombifrons]